MTRLARVQPRDLQLLHRTAHRIAKIDFDLVFEVAAAFPLWLHRPAAVATEKLTEEIAEVPAARASLRSASTKIESPEIKIHSGIATRVRGPCSRLEIVAVKAVLVVHLPLLGIGQNVVGFLQLLELFFRGLIPRIQVRVIFARELAECRANLLRIGLSRNSQQLVIVLFGRRCHFQPENCRGATVLR